MEARPDPLVLSVGSQMVNILTEENVRKSLSELTGHFPELGGFRAL